MVKLKRIDPNVVKTPLYSSDAILREKQIKAPFRKSHPGPPRKFIPKRRGYRYTNFVTKKTAKRFLSPSKRGSAIAAKKSGIKRKEVKNQKSKKLNYSKREKYYTIGGQKKYRGVQQNKKSGKFFTQKIINGKNTTLGTFALAEDAARCFDLETFRQKGRSYKRYNFPENLAKYETTVTAERRSM